MPEPDERDAEQASIDEAVERLEQHDEEREASRKQGQIQKETRRRGMDDG